MKVLVAGASARAVAESVARGGHETFAVDVFGDRDLLEVASWRKLDDDESVAGAIAEFGADGVTFASGVENNPDLVEGLRALGVRVFAPGCGAIRRCRDNDVLAEVCGRNDIARPAVFSSPPPDKALLVKPLAGGAGIGVRDWDGDPSSVAEGEYFQEKIEGAPLSAVFAADGKEAVVLGVSRQFAGEAFLGADGYAWCGNLMPFGFAPEERGPLLAELRRIASALAADLGLSGACGADFIFDGRTPWLLEINPRICASFELAELLGGVNMFNVHAAALEGRLPRSPERLLEGPFMGKGIVYAPRDMTAPDTDGWLGTDRHDIPQAFSPLPAGLPICTVITPPLEDEGAVVAYLEDAARRIWGECS